EDGIRDRNVTGVQACALPISGAARDVRRLLRRRSDREPGDARPDPRGHRPVSEEQGREQARGGSGEPPFPDSESKGADSPAQTRAEERRVGKGGRTGRTAAPY